MAFWGVEVKPGKAYTHPSSKTSGRLRLSQATLGFGESTKKSLVQCNVGKKSPVLLCCLLPDKSEYCHLELEFDEDDEVVFSVIGPRSVHLTGYYLISNHIHRHRGFDDSSDSYGEDVGKSDTDKSNNCSDEDEYDDSFINDGDVEVCPSSPAFSSEEMEGEIMDDKESHEKKGFRRSRRIRMFQISDSEDDGSISQQGVVVKSTEIKDEDNIQISSLTRRGKTGKQKVAEDEVTKVAVESDTRHNSNQSAEKPNEANVFVDADPKSEPGIQHTSVPATLEDLQQNAAELKAAKRKAKKRERKGKIPHPDSIGDNDIRKDKLQVDETKEKCQKIAIEKKPDADAPQSDERKSKRKRRKIKENEHLASVEKQAMPAKYDATTLKTFSNGLVVEELDLGKPNGEVASLGRKVKIHYTGKLKEGGHVYKTSIGSDPFKFRLGKGKTIKGLQLGLEGMRVGGRRRLTIPPELGYGSKGDADSVPPHSWLKLDVELLNVR